MGIRGANLSCGAARHRGDFLYRGANLFRHRPHTSRCFAQGAVRRFRVMRCFLGMGGLELDRLLMVWCSDLVVWNGIEWITKFPQCFRWSLRLCGDDPFLGRHLVGESRSGLLLTRETIFPGALAL